MFKSNRRPVLISFLVIAISLFLYWPPGIPFFNLMELKTIDLRFLSRGNLKHNDNIALVTIDEKSIDNEGRWPWDRKKIASLIDRISDSGAKVLGFDVGFFDHDLKIAMKTAGRIKSRIVVNKGNRKIYEYIDKVIKESDNDRILSDAIKNSKTKIVTGFFFHMGKDSEISDHLDKGKKIQQKKNISGARIKGEVRYDSEGATRFPLIRSSFPESNITKVSKATPYSGFFNMFVDQDGVIRRLPSIIQHEKTLYAPLSLKVLAAYKDRNISVKIADNYGVEEVRLGNEVIPTDELGRIMINYRGPSKTFRHISATDILSGKIKKEELKDKILLFGATAVGIYDLRITPVENNFPGLEIHANVVDSILSKDFLYRPDWSAWFDITAMFIGCVLLGIVLSYAGSTSGAFATVLILGGHIVFCQQLFASTGIIVSIIYPIFAMILTYVSIVGYKYFIEEGQKRFIRSAFSTYLAPSVVKQLLDQPDKLGLGGQQKDITAFFSDVEGFTKISEKLSATELVDLLNEFLTDMTDIILHHKGTVDKFEGDAIIAFFGAPIDLPNHSDIAVRASIDMQKKLAEKREIWKKEGRDELKMRIGLCSGPAVVGNMGSANRMDYTMMGDTVNQAARLEGVNKIYGVYTMISETTRKHLKDDIVVRELDSVIVVGKKKPVSVFEVIGYFDEIDNKTIDGLKLFEEALGLYRKGDFKTAIDKFTEVMSYIPEDPPSLVMIGRCYHYIENPPESWDGNYSMKTK